MPSRMNISLYCWRGLRLLGVAPSPNNIARQSGLRRQAPPVKVLKQVNLADYCKNYAFLRLPAYM